MDVSPERNERWPDGDGAAARLFRGFAWHATSLGPVDTWSARLRASVETLLATRQPQGLVCGPDRLLLHNDALGELWRTQSSPVFGHSLGNGTKSLPEWLAPACRRAMGGEAFVLEDEDLDAGDGAEASGDVFLTPIRDEGGRIAHVHFALAVAKESRRTQAILRESEERHAFMLQLGDLLRPAADLETVRRITLDALKVHLEAGDVHYLEIQPPGEAFRIFGTRWSGGSAHADPVPLARLGARPLAELRLGRSVRMDDVALDPTLSAAERSRFLAENTRSCMGVPLVRAGHLTAVLAVEQDEPRRWTPGELRTLEETAGRLWDATERTRAGAASFESQDGLLGFTDASSDILWIRDAATLRYTYLNSAFECILGMDRASVLQDPDNHRAWLAMIDERHRDGFIRCLEGASKGERHSFEYHLRRRETGQAWWFRSTVFPIPDAGGEIRQIGGIVQDITEVKRIEQALRENEGRLRLATAIGRVGLWDDNIRTGRMHWSDELYRILGYDPGEVQPDRAAWVARVHPDDLEATLAVLSRARTMEQEYQHEYRVVRLDGTVLWCLSRGQFIYDAKGRPTRMVGAMLDVTERRQLIEQQTVLVAELQHRTRNLIAVVGSIARQTMARTGPTEAFQPAFAARLSALSRVQGLLARGTSERITIRELVDMELQAIGEARARSASLEGPEVFLRKSMVQTMALALHELATNARKYGALSGKGGSLAIRWTRLEDGGGLSRLHLEWHEGGIDTSGSENRSGIAGGYGRQLIEKALPYSLQARTTYELGSGRLICTIDLPLERKPPARR